MKNNAIKIKSKDATRNSCTHIVCAFFCKKKKDKRANEKMLLLKIIQHQNQIKRPNGVVLYTLQKKKKKKKREKCEWTAATKTSRPFFFCFLPAKSDANWPEPSGRGANEIAFRYADQPSNDRRGTLLLLLLFFKKSSADSIHPINGRPARVDDFQRNVT